MVGRLLGQYEICIIMYIIIYIICIICIICIIMYIICIINDHSVKPQTLAIRNRQFSSNV